MTDVPTTTEPPFDTCAGTVRSSNGGPCRCNPLADCFSCHLAEGPNDSVLGETCTRCKNGKFLFRGQCITTCPSGFLELGLGSFGKTCQSTSNLFCTNNATINNSPCQCEEDACFSCSLASPTLCVECKPERFLLDGACVDACPENYFPNSDSNGLRTCVQIRPGVCDDSSMLDLVFPEVDFGLLQDALTRDMFFAALTLSLEASRVNTTLFCDISLSAKVVPVVTIISSAEVVELVRNVTNAGLTAFVFGGERVVASVSQQFSTSAELCFGATSSTGDSCSCKPLSNCRDCVIESQYGADGMFRGSICTRCKNGRALYNGDCVDECPLGFYPDGNGLFNIRCTPAVDEPPLRFLTAASQITFTSGFSVIKPNIAIGFTTNLLSLRLRIEANGLVFTVADETGARFMSLGVENGRIVARLNFGFGTLRLATEDGGYVDGQFHNVSLMRVDTHLSLSVDMNPIVQGSATAPSGTRVQFGPLVFVGAAAPLSSESSFLGCVDNVLLDSVPLILPRAEASMDVGECGDDACFMSPCTNGGTCVPTESGFYCLCPPGYGSATCAEPLDICASLRPCRNGGTCSVLPQSAPEAPDEFVCNCKAGSFGSLCENSFDLQQPFSIDAGGLVGVDSPFSLHDSRVVIELYPNSTTTSILAITSTQSSVRLAAGFDRGTLVLELSEDSAVTAMYRSSSIWPSMEFLTLTLQFSSSGSISALIEDVLVLSVPPVPSLELLVSTSNTSLFIDSAYRGCVGNIRVNDSSLADIDTAVATGISPCSSSPCDPSPCLNGASECTAVGLFDFECTCAELFTGKRCEVFLPYCFDDPDVSVSFSVARFFVLDTASSVRRRIYPDKPLALSMNFRVPALDTSVTLFSMEYPGQDFGSLQMSARGQLFYTSNYGGARLVAIASGSFNDGEWHSISLMKSLTEALFIVDDGVSVAGAEAMALVSDGWEALFSEPVLGVMIGDDIGSPIRGVELDVCARRCLDEQLCVSFDYRPQYNSSITLAVEPSRCSLNAGVVGRLSATVDTLHYTLRSATATIQDSARVSFGLISAPSDPSSGMSGDASGDGTVPCRTCLGSISANGFPIDVSALSGVELALCTN